MEYKLIRSKRKTVSVSIDKDGNIVVRAPLKTGVKFIENFIDKNRDWIEKQQAKIAQAEKNKIVLTDEQIKQLKKEAEVYMPQITDKYAAIMGLEYSGVKITSAKKRWGSCNSKKGICYSYRIMVLPECCREYIAVHELAHMVHMNHSKKFYALIKKYIPNYKEIEKEIAAFYIA